jgi:murein DD-endopeptidase MepM/ murein hydrolase activator NlpD
LVLGLAVAALSAKGAGAETPDGTIRLSLPVSCTPGRTCWISKFVDLDPGKGVRDFACFGRANDGHKGIDIALRDIKAMEDGVAVLAAAPGVVKGTRDGMEDVSVRKEGRAALGGNDCGNGVAIAHDGGWVTQYCHMRRGSIGVTTGNRVEAGKTLGLVGLSGNTKYPHLHIELRHQDKVVDPFLGLEGRPGGRSCGLGKAPLWSPAALEALRYTPAAIYNVGFAASPPEQEDVRGGRLRATELASNAPVLVFWEPGDRLAMRLTAPDGAVLVNHEKPVEKRRARWFQYVDSKRHAGAWPPGWYRAEVSLARTMEGKTVHTAVTRELVIR